MKILTVVGARPQFIKAAAVARAMSKDPSGQIEHLLVHTGQHYDENMSGVFFDQLDLPEADVNLGIGGGFHGEMTGAMLAGIEKELFANRPDCVLIYGDTDSTLAGALAAAKLHIPVAHVEAGLRSYNRRMPEEINRVLSDHMASYLLCPTQLAVRNLQAEGIEKGVHLVGDVMYDAALHYGPKAAENSLLSQLGVGPGGYFLATCHRAENTDKKDNLAGILEGLTLVGEIAPVVLPLHPRTRNCLKKHGLSLGENIRTMPPVNYLEMIDLTRNARAVLTDSGGVQKEAYFHGVPCITMRTETEWVETVETGWNTIVMSDPIAIQKAASRCDEVREKARPDLYGRGDAAERIVRLLVEPNREGEP